MLYITIRSFSLCHYADISPYLFIIIILLTLTFSLRCHCFSFISILMPFIDYDIIIIDATSSFILLFRLIIIFLLLFTMPSFISYHFIFIIITLLHVAITLDIAADAYAAFCLFWLFSLLVISFFIITIIAIVIFFILLFSSIHYYSAFSSLAFISYYFHYTHHFISLSFLLH